MQLEFAFTCDYADSTSMVVAIGIGFDQIHAPGLPARHPRLCVVARFRPLEARAPSHYPSRID